MLVYGVFSPMATLAPSNCTSPNCPNVVTFGRFCDEHRRKAKRPRMRGTAAQRGYGYRWRRLRRRVLAEQPLCTDPFNLHSEDNRTEIATDVDHIVPRADGGTDERGNLQPLCHSCHSRKTAQAQTGRGR